MDFRFTRRVGLGGLMRLNLSASGVQAIDLEPVAIEAVAPQDAPSSEPNTSKIDMASLAWFAMACGLGACVWLLVGFAAAVIACWSTLCFVATVRVFCRPIGDAKTFVAGSIVWAVVAIPTALVWWWLA
jgi:hypothetical protein